MVKKTSELSRFNQRVTSFSTLMLKIPAIILFVVITLVILPKQTFAAFEFSSAQNAITDTEEMIISVSLDLSSSTANNTYYLRGAFYKEGTTQYFGFTINNQGEAYNGPFSDCQKLYGITVDAEGNWTGEIKVKADPEDSAFEGSGDYLLKVSRYTTSCSNTWADTEPINVTITQTVFPSPSPSSASESNPSNSSSTSSSNSPSSTPKSSPKASSKKSPSPSPKVLAAATNEPSKPQGSQPPMIEDSISQVDPNQFNAPTPSPATQQPSKKVAGMLVGSGAVLIGISVAGFLYYKKQEEHPKIQKEKERFEEKE